MTPIEASLQAHYASRAENEVANFDYEYVLNGYNELIGYQLRTLGLENEVSVVRDVSHRNADDYKDVLTLGIAGEPELSIATLAATNSNTDEAEDGTKIATLFFPPSRHGLHLQKDEKSKTLWSDFFYTCEDGVITPVRTDKPIQIDSVLPYKIDSATECDDDYFPGRKMLEEITNDKWKTQEVLLRSGISVPSTLFLPAEYVADTEAAIKTFAQAYPDGFVVKATHGSQGSNVRLFDQTALDALPYAHSLQEQGKDIVLQERIIPHPLILPEGKEQIDQHDVDHNLRVLVTIGEDPLILDAEIRYAQKSGKPVNVSRGAHALKSHNLLRSLPQEMLFDMYDTSIRASCALYEATDGKIYDTVGYIGLDIIIDRGGKATVIEANSGCVGGLGTLSKIAREPLKSVGEKLLLSAQPVLQRNHEKRLERPESPLQPLALENNDVIDIAHALYFAGLDTKAEKFLREYDVKLPQVFYSLLNGDRLRDQEEYERAIAEYADVFLFDGSQEIVAENISHCLLDGGYADICAGFLDSYYKNLGYNSPDASYTRAYCEFLLTGDIEKAVPMLYSFQDIPQSESQELEKMLREKTSEETANLADFSQQRHLSKEEFIHAFIGMTAWAGHMDKLLNIGQLCRVVTGDIDLTLLHPYLEAICDKYDIQEDLHMKEGVLIATGFVEAMIKNGQIPESRQNELLDLLTNQAENEYYTDLVKTIKEKYPYEDKNAINLFALSQADYTLQNTMKDLVDSPDQLPDIAEGMTSEVYYKYLYLYVDAGINYFEIESDVAGNIQHIQLSFDDWQQPESDKYLDKYTQALQKQLGVSFRPQDTMVQMFRKFYATDEKSIRAKLLEATQGIKLAWKKRRRINDVLRDPEKFRIASSTKDRYGQFVIETISKSFDTIYAHHMMLWGQEYGEERTELFREWMIQDAYRVLVDRMDPTSEELLFEGSATKVRGVIQEIIQTDTRSTK